MKFFVQSRSTSKPCFSLSGVEHRSQRPRVNFFLLRTDPLFDHLLSFTLFIFRAKNQLLLFSATKLARFGGKLMMTQQVFSLTKRVNFLHKNIFYLAMDSCFLRRSQILLRIFKLIRQLEPVLLTFENFPGRGEKFFSGTENGNKFLKKKLKTCEVVTDHCCRRIQNCSNDVTLLVRRCYPRYLKSALPGLRINIIH